MDKHYFIELLKKYIKGETTDEENSVLLTYYNLFQSELDVTALMIPKEKDDLKNVIKEALWENIDRKEQLYRSETIRNKWIVRAAAILIAVCVSALFLANPSVKKPNVLNLLNKQKENRLICLPDGSRVILASGSKLNYPSSFDGLAKREVYLVGEAFFDITHNPFKRFIVHTGKLEVSVLGTAFNIKSLINDSDITVVVSRGKVKISDTNNTLGLLTRGEQITYHKSKGNFLQERVNADSNIAWKRQDLFLDDVTVGEAAKLLEDKFSVNISFSDPEIETKRFTTVFLKSEDLEQILRSICEFNSALYNYDAQKSTVTISKIKP